jgi:hypothetical protein
MIRVHYKYETIMDQKAQVFISKMWGFMGVKIMHLSIDSP